MSNPTAYLAEPEKHKLTHDPKNPGATAYLVANNPEEVSDDAPETEVLHIETGEISAEDAEKIEAAIKAAEAKIADAAASVEEPPKAE